MGTWLSTEKDSNPTKEVEDYCRSMIFIKFYGQTSCMDGETDKSYIDRQILGHNMKALNKELRKAESPSEFKINDEMRKIIRRIAERRKCTLDFEDDDTCYERLVKDAEKFAEMYRCLDQHSDDLADEHDYYWGTRQQLMCGKVISDWLEKKWRMEKGESHERPIDPVFGALFNPTGGRVGPGDTGWFHNMLYDDFGRFAYHSAVHDAFGYLMTCHKTGPGYNYLNKGLFGDASPLGGQFSGLEFWEKELKTTCPESPDAVDKFCFK